MQFFIPLGYTFIWFFIHFLLQFSSSKYLKKKTQWNNFITALHAFLLPLITLIYFLTLADPLGYDYLVDDVIRHFLAAGVGFYIFSTINLYRVDRQPAFDMIFHHIVVGGFLFYAYCTPEYPAYYALIIIPQCTAFIYHTYLILKETEGVSENKIEAWYEANFWGWIIMRFILQGMMTVMAFYYEFTLLKLTLPVRIMTIIGFSFSYYFNLHWLIILLKKRKQKRLLT